MAPEGGTKWLLLRRQAAQNEGEHLRVLGEAPEHCGTATALPEVAFSKPQSEIWPHEWLPKLPQNRFQIRLGSQRKRQLDSTLIKERFSKLSRLYESLKCSKTLLVFKDFAYSSLQSFIFN